jgi:hypothetical protein
VALCYERRDIDGRRKANDRTRAEGRKKVLKMKMARTSFETQSMKRTVNSGRRNRTHGAKRQAGADIENRG